MSSREVGVHHIWSQVKDMQFKVGHCRKRNLLGGGRMVSSLLSWHTGCQAIDLFFLLGPRHLIVAHPPERLLR